MSTGPLPDDRMVEFYAANYSEGARLSRPKSRLEFLRTQELLRNRLPAAPSRLMDVGGGTGAHAAWLAADGHEVQLIDVVPEHVRQAREVSAGLTRGFTAHVGDARAIEAPDASVDVCLMLGPLYHLPERADRAVALAEAMRITRPGGLVFAAAMSRYAWPLYGLREGGGLLAERAAAITTTLATGCGDPVGSLPAAYSHRPTELARELEDAGALDVEVLGIEGPGWILFRPEVPEERFDALLDDALRAARLCDGHPDMTGVSAHLLACGLRPS